MDHIRQWTGRGENHLTRVHSRPERSLYRQLSAAEEDTTVFGRRERESLVGAGTTTTAASSFLNFVTLTDESSDEEVELLSADIMRMTRLRAEKQRGGDAVVDGGGGGGVTVAPTSRKSRDVHFVEREIDEGDTMPSLALRYNCKVSLIKRINNIMSEQEFYGLRRIKVPVAPNSAVEERLTLENELRELSRGAAATCGHPVTCQEPSASTDGSHTVTVCNQRFISIGGGSNSAAAPGGAAADDDDCETRHFLRRMDLDLEKIRSSVVVHKNSLEEAALVLTAKRFRPLVVAERPNGGGRTIPKLRVWIFLVIVVLIVLPIVLVLFILYGRHKS